MQGAILLMQASASDLSPPPWCLMQRDVCVRTPVASPWPQGVTISTLHLHHTKLSSTSSSPGVWNVFWVVFFFLCVLLLQFKVRVIGLDWYRFISKRKACFLCTLGGLCCSIILHVLQNTVIRQTVKKSISYHHVSFWLTADSRRQAKVQSAL